MRQTRFITRAAALLVTLPAMTAHAECSLGVSDVVFGEYDVFAPNDSLITGSVGLSCDSETNVQVALSAGNGTFDARRMLNGTHSLFYNLYLDAGRLSLWGDGSPGTNVLGLSGSGGNYTIYGRIPARQNVRSGLYSDTIVVSLTF